MIKAAYILWATDYHLDRLIDSGVTRFLIPDYNTPPVAKETKQMPSHSRTLEIIKKYSNKIGLILVPIWFQPWVILPKNERFVDEAGKEWKRTPCPTAGSYFKKRFGYIETLLGDLYGVVWDIEDYMSHHDGTTYFFSEDEMPRCYCPTCRTLSRERQYQIFEALWSKYITKYNHMGFTPYSHEWIIDLFPNKATWYAQSTYKKNKYMATLKRKLFGVTNPAMAGVWLEYHHHSKINKYVKDVMARRPFGLGYEYDGVWLYTHCRLGGHLPCEGPYCKELDDTHYRVIGDLNG